MCVCVLCNVMSSSNAFNWNFIINLSGTSGWHWIFGFINLCAIHSFIQLVNAENVKLYQFNFIKYAQCARIHTIAFALAHILCIIFTNQSPTALHLSPFWNVFEAAKTVSTLYILLLSALPLLSTTTQHLLSIVLLLWHAVAAIRPHNVPYRHTDIIITILLQSSAFTNYVNSSHHISNNYIIIMIISTNWYMYVNINFRIGLAWLGLVWLILFLFSTVRERGKRHIHEPNENCARLETTMQFMEASHVHVWTPKKKRTEHERTHQQKRSFNQFWMNKMANIKSKNATEYEWKNTRSRSRRKNVEEKWVCPELKWMYTQAKMKSRRQNSPSQDVRKPLSLVHGMHAARCTHTNTNHTHKYT